MNYQIAIAGGITALALLAHVFVGVRETLATAPEKIAEKARIQNFHTIERNWIQALCAFQLVTVDLFVLSALSFIVAFTDLIGPRKYVALGLAALYALWGTVWMFQLLVLRRPARDFLLLGHWAVWFICAVLVFWGAYSL